MSQEPQASPYRPDYRLKPLARWLGSEVAAADFPEHRLRFRNDRWAGAVGLSSLSDEQWIAHFGRFEPLPDNMPGPLALKYHGHQFRVYNPDIGDGRGFLFAQLRDGEDRLLDLGTKGSGRTPYSRDGDGRLTLKGAVREILATEMLEALGVCTSKTFSVIETGEELRRGDEPSPTRSAVMVRLSHGHIRIGTFQRLLVLEEIERIEELVSYCLEAFPGAQPPGGATAASEPAVIFMHQVVARMADLAASYMAAGFVHGVLNTDNMNVSGESFDYGPWRWLPRWDPAFTAAYFDHAGLYAFGRQPEAFHWNCAQLAIALRPIADSEPLIAALDSFAGLYRERFALRFAWRLGVRPKDVEENIALVSAAEAHMRDAGISPDELHFRHRGGRDAPTGAFGDLLRTFESTEGGGNSFWQADAPPTLHIDEVERVWAAIAENDDWQPLRDKVGAIRELGAALGTSPQRLG
ncbi:UPF0061 protein [Novosphingobium marinum]|uniref:Uncharacterized protein YdiU (UPF0061 family) n=1 Tax=Novosphingobium marinum TaxID=1514948 RepID=A0A7Y9XV58_9SPHN|nr:YdiU family protein [Novosphingobium marinum]NYH95174.1 uncharacterized protein YdiU (UPF0061 family) [Novosphingobium marinum]GGC24909.1 UPF0061 protein [Novosphingobium marinum]